MTALLTPPQPTPPASGLRPFRWTVSLFHQLGELGVFKGRRPKLINGHLVEEGQMNPPHATALERTDEAMRGAFGKGWRFRVQMPLVLGQDTDPMPDMAILQGVPGALAHPTRADLVVEVADSSLGYDTTTKAELYATAGIAEYWVVDVDGRRLLVFRDPVPLPQGLGATAYQTRLTLTAADAVAPLAAPAAPVRVADLLP